MKQLARFTKFNTNEKASIFISKIFGFQYSSSLGCVILLSDAGGVFPVSESEKEVELILLSKEEGCE